MQLHLRAGRTSHATTPNATMDQPDGNRSRLVLIQRFERWLRLRMHAKGEARLPLRRAKVRLANRQHDAHVGIDEDKGHRGRAEEGHGRRSRRDEREGEEQQMRRRGQTGWRKERETLSQG